MTIIKVASQSGHQARVEEEFSDDDDDDTATETEGTAAANNDFMDEDSISMNLGKVYEKTIGILGGDLASFPPPESGQQPPAPLLSEDVEIIDL